MAWAAGSAQCQPASVLPGTGAKLVLTCSDALRIEEARCWVRIPKQAQCPRPVRNGVSEKRVVNGGFSGYGGDPPSGQPVGQFPTSLAPRALHSTERWARVL